MNSIKGKLTKSYFKIILVSIVVLEVILFFITRNYLYSNLQQNLLGQVRNSGEIYNKFFSTNSVEENVLLNIDVFWAQTVAHVQIIDLDGNVIMDSEGITYNEKITSKDFISALNNEYSFYIGHVDYFKEKVMAVSYPLKKGENNDGILRFTTSLRTLNNNLFIIIGILIIIGLIVAIVSALFGIIFSSLLSGPIRSLTAYAEKMAKGDFKNKMHIKGNDEIVKLNDTLNYMADEIEKKDRLKNEFICSISHELRTPLTAIKGWAIVLNCDDNDKKTLSQGLTIIEKESDRLSGMVEQLLDFSKFISGKVSLKKEESSLQELCLYLEDCLKPRAEREKVDLKITCQEDLPLIIMDSNRIKQVCINILDNAFKFLNDNGKVTLDVSQVGNYIEFVFEDNGCGISEDDLPNVKEKFYKGKNSKSQNGIGLSICDEIITLHKGKFYISSKIDIGTKVVIEIPVEKSGG